MIAFMVRLVILTVQEAVYPVMRRAPDAFPSQFRIVTFAETFYNTTGPSTKEHIPPMPVPPVVVWRDMLKVHEVIFNV